ncbi:nucleotidyltransferase domain-containing protein [Methylobacterium sp. WL19]|uniref:nucleotidyltransferase family protein n=1 Tax=Methylobacterium sp. WL19 TaxID=2603896 RepID=UPI001FEDF91B|nr:nucleotidyltransferase domain-containing protein [Methylobacterium sp. WL19]
MRYRRRMDSRTAIGILRAHEGELQRRGVRHAALFGSVARGESHAGSDIDVMIEIDETTIRSVYDYVGVIDFIGELFPISVDVSNKDMLKPHVRPAAERDAIHAF